VKTLIVNTDNLFTIENAKANISKAY